MSIPPIFTPITIPPAPSIGNRLILRSPTLSDAPSLFARAQNPFCVSQIPGLRYGKPSLADYESLISTWQTQSIQLKSRFLIIELASTGESIGDAGFESLRRAIHGYGDKVSNGETMLQIGEAGIMLDDSSAIRGKGYAVEALNIVFEYGFCVVGLDGIRVRTMEQKFGFDHITNLVTSETAVDNPGTGSDYESMGDAPLGRTERYWKLMSDRVEEGIREVAVCYCIEREKWEQWVKKTIA
jgi:RimJ/RimL family protein N-acetyltransferase